MSAGNWKMTFILVFVLSAIIAGFFGKDNIPPWCVIGIILTFFVPISDV